MKTVILNPMPVGIEGKTLKEQFIKVGGNSGNLVFFEALKEELKYTDIITVKTQTELIPQDASIVVPSSNFLCKVNNTFFFDRFIDFFNRVDNPITFCGLGAQSTKLLNTPKKLVDSLQPVQKKFFKMLSERATSIGVRGDFTAECLSLMGIHNFRVIGCPSFYKYLNGLYPDITVTNLCGGGIQMTVTPGIAEYSKLLELGMENQCFWIIQEMREYPQTMNIFGRNVVSYKWLLKNIPGTRLNGKKILEYNSKLSRVFWDIQSWNDFYKKENIKFAFGTRFHGNMAALRNGIPALWITHDSRTRELTSYMHLPSIDATEISKVNKLEELLEYCDYTELKKNYKALSIKYVEYLNENNLSHRYLIS